MILFVQTNVIKQIILSTQKCDLYASQFSPACMKIKEVLRKPGFFAFYNDQDFIDKYSII